jgi:XamI-like restriction endonuclease
MKSPPVWSPEELESDRRAAIEAFRVERLEEPLERYLEAFDDYQGVIEELLETTADLRQLDQTALDLLSERRFAVAFRYLAGPIISADDLQTLAEAVLSPARLRQDPAMVARIVEVIRTALDRRRFAWVAERREPDEEERSAAVLATAALMANTRAGTQRRSQGKSSQELAVQQKLVDSGLRMVARRSIPTLRQAPAPGELCPESDLGKRKADVIVTLWDGR